MLGGVAKLVRVAPDQVVNDNVSLRYFGTHAQVNAKPLRWHDRLALTKVNLFHKVAHVNMVRDVLSEREMFQAMATI